jgi:hypothetical protein
MLFDAQSIQSAEATEALRQALQECRDWAAQNAYGHVFHLIVVGGRELSQLNDPDGSQDIIVLHGDGAIAEAVRLHIAARVLTRKAGLQVATGDLAALIADHLQEVPEVGHPLANLDQFIGTLSKILTQRRLELTSVRARAEAAQIYRRLAGARIPPQFRRETIENAAALRDRLSADSVRNRDRPGEGLYGLDTLLRELGADLSYWLEMGNQGSPAERGSRLRIYLFIGPRGSGKTKTVNGLGDVVGFRVETVKGTNLTKMQDESSGAGHYQRSLEAVVLERMQAAADRNTMSLQPGLVFLDEGHAVKNGLLALVGAADNTAPGVVNDDINLDGQVVVIAMNIVPDHPTYEKLIHLNPTDPDYEKLVFELAEATLAHGKNALPLEAVGPLLSRMHGIFFFPPFGHEQRERAIGDTVTKTATNLGCEIFVQDDARTALAAGLARREYRNYRALDWISEEIKKALSVWRMKRTTVFGRPEFAGRLFILRANPDQTPGVMSCIVEDGHEPRNVHFWIEASFRSYQRRVGAALAQLHADARDSNQADATLHQLTRDAFEDVGNRPLINSADHGQEEDPVVVVPKGFDFPLQAITHEDTDPSWVTFASVLLKVAAELGNDAYGRGQIGKAKPLRGNPDILRRLGLSATRRRDVAHKLVNLVHAIQQLLCNENGERGASRNTAIASFLRSAGAYHRTQQTEHSHPQDADVELEFMEAKLLELRESHARNEDELSPRKRDAEARRLGLGWGVELSELIYGEDPVDEDSLRAFLDQLVLGATDTAETIIEARRKTADNRSQSVVVPLERAVEADSSDAPFDVEQHRQLVHIATAVILDKLGRDAARVHYSREWEKAKKRGGVIPSAHRRPPSLRRMLAMRNLLARARRAPRPR